jgi:HPr Serine kinase C-terminal domain
VSRACHLFSWTARRAYFRAKVIANVTKLHLINRAVLPLHAELLIAGAHCALATNSEEVLDSVSRWRCTSRPRSSRTFDLDVVLDPSLPSFRDLKTQTHFRGLHHLVFATIGTHELFTFDLLRKRVVGAVSTATACDRLFWNSHWLPITVGVMGTTIGVVPLHSACLEFNGAGLLLAGLSGAGKSTLSVALARRGFSLVSDDWTYLSQEADELVAHGLCAPVKLLPDAVRHFPELQGRTPKLWFNGELAFEVDPEEICQARPKTHSRPRWLMLLERSPAPGCDFAPFNAADARAFFERNAERLPNEIPEASATRSALIGAAANCKCWRVRSGESPQATAEAIGRFCERN